MNEQSEKKEWTSPEIIDLDVMETAGTKDGIYEHDIIQGPAS